MNKPSIRPDAGSFHWNEVWELIVFLLAHILCWCVLVVSLGLLASKTSS